MSIHLIFIASLIFVATCILCWLGFKGGAAFWEEYKATFKEGAQANMADLFMFVDTGRLFLFNIIGIVVAPLVIYLLSGNVVYALITLITLAILPWIIYRQLHKRRLKLFEKQLPDAFIMLSSSLQAGASLTMALEGLVKEQPAPLSQEFQLLIHQQRMGVDLETAFSNMEKRLPVQDFSIAVSAIKISREVGGNLVEVMDTLAETLRRKATMEGKIESLTAQGKLQGVVMSGLPILLALLLMKLEPVAMGMLFTTSVGWTVLSIVVVMEVLGFMAIRKITNIDV